MISGDCFVHILPAIPTKGKTKSDIPEVIETVRNVMKDEFKRLSIKAREYNLADSIKSD